MRIFKGNTIKIAVACFIIFMAIPFIFVESSDLKKGQSPTIPMEQSANPLTRFLDRIGSFYGFKKANKGNTVKAGNSSFDKAPVNLASAKKQGRFIEPGNLRKDKNPEDLQRGTDAKTGIVPNTVPSGKARLPEVKEYVRMDGGTYEVIKDHEGRKYVALPDGFVPYEKLMSDTVSQEEFEAAKVQAPQLEDWEIFEALRTPGGLNAYLANGGRNTYSANNNRSSQNSKYGNKEGTRLFGRPGSGKAELNDDIYDERKLTASIQANKGILVSGGKGSNIGRSLTDSLKDKYNDINKNNDNDKNDTSDFSSLISNGVVIGSDVIKLKVDGNGRGSFKSSGGTSYSDTTIKPKADVNSYMAKTMNENIMPKTDINGNPVDNIWIYPENFEGYTPGTLFANVNHISVSFEESDKIYKDGKKKIEDIKVNIPNLKVALIDGIEGQQVKSVDSKTYQYKMVEGLTGVHPLNDINIGPEEKSETLVIVSDTDTFNGLKKAGYNVVLFNNFAITPSDTENFYQDTVNTVKNMAQEKQLADAKTAKKAKNSAVLAQDVVNAKVGVRGT